MSGSATKAEKRELRKVLGDQAAEMVASLGDRVTNLARENEALAREFVLLRSGVQREHATLHGRIDGASKWAEKNEAAIDKLPTMSRVVALETELAMVKFYMYRGFFGRLKWLLRGK